MLEMLYRSEGMLFSQLLEALDWPRQELLSKLMRLQQYGVLETSYASSRNKGKCWRICVSCHSTISSFLTSCEGVAAQSNAIKVEV